MYRRQIPNGFQLPVANRLAADGLRCERMSTASTRLQAACGQTCRATGAEPWSLEIYLVGDSGGVHDTVILKTVDQAAGVAQFMHGLAERSF